MTARGFLFVGLTAGAFAEVNIGYKPLTTLDETGKRMLQSMGEALDLDVCSNSQPNPITAAIGTIHDDEVGGNVDCVFNSCSCGAGNEQSSQCHIGYGDNLNCGKHIQAPEGQAVHLLFQQFNLESCADNSCDSVTVYDGADANAPVLGSFTGSQVPPRIISTGRDIFIQFVTDHGNAAIDAHGDPGFYADWYFELHLDDEGICNAGYGSGTVENLNSDGYIIDAHGTLHDDIGNQNIDCSVDPAACGSVDNAGYGDDLNCYITLHAPEGETVRLTFTQLNLEGPEPRPGCQLCTDERGCDWVEIFDGADENAPSLGTFSGNPATMPTVLTTQQNMHVRFLTDHHNCGISSTEDPGFFADWDFVEAGEDICSPTAAVLRTEHGVLHDDDVFDTAGSSGYGDNLDCGVRLRAHRGETINLHMVQMNLEGGNTFMNGDSVQCSDFGDDACDYIYVYDGRNADAPLIATWTGDIVDTVNGGDAITSSGRDLYVRFVTDAGNGGIPPGHANLNGFWAEWSFITDGAECDHGYTMTPNTGIVGHNQEFLTLPLDECQAACCARDWCKSIDFGRDNNICILADVDAAVQQGRTDSNNFYDLYERTHVAAVSPALGPAGCATELEGLAEGLNAACCGPDQCVSSMPDSCSQDCAALWVPFATHCSQYLQLQSNDVNLGAADTFAPLLTLSADCETTEYGHYHPGSNHGRCGDSDYQQYLEELSAACCDQTAGSGDLAYCPQNAAMPPGQFALEVPTFNGQPYCDDDCRSTAEQWYVECRPRLEEDRQTMLAVEGFIAVCQGMPSTAVEQPGGGS